MHETEGELAMETEVPRAAYCIVVDTQLEGRVPAFRDNPGQPYIFATLREAQLEIADTALTHIEEFIAGERDFDDAMTIEEYIVEVDVYPDGSVVDSEGCDFGAG